MENCSGGNLTDGGILSGSEFYWNTRQSVGIQIACVHNSNTKIMAGRYQSDIRWGSKLF